MAGTSTPLDEALAGVSAIITDPMKPILAAAKDGATAQFRDFMFDPETRDVMFTAHRQLIQNATLSYKIEGAVSKELRKLYITKPDLKGPSPMSYKVTYKVPLPESLSDVRKYVVGGSRLVGPILNRQDRTHLAVLAARGMLGVVPAGASDGSVAEAIAPLIAAPTGEAMDVGLVEAALHIASDPGRAGAMLGVHNLDWDSEEVAHAVGEMQAEARAVLGWRPWRLYSRAVHHELSILGSPGPRVFGLVPRKAVAVIVMALSCMVGSVAASDAISNAVAGGAIQRSVSVAGVAAPLVAKAAAGSVTTPVGKAVGIVKTNYTNLPVPVQWTVNLVITGDLYWLFQTVRGVALKKLKNVATSKLRRDDK
jgi:hypothetical protein